MRKIHEELHLSATDLVGHMNCGHLTALDIKVTAGELGKPAHWDPLLEILRERGFRHEQAFIDHLNSAGLKAVTIEGVEIADTSVAATIEAMKAGYEIIIQGALRQGRWSGRADILRRVETPSIFGAWSYEIMDTKLARETKSGTVLQLCLYSELLRDTQQAQPEFAHVVVPWTDHVPQSYRVADYAAYFRKAKAAVERVTTGAADEETYPEPIDHCDICRWYDSCDKRRRDDDHLSFVAGISRNQITELRENGVNTLAALAALPTPIGWKPQRGAVQSYEKVKKQALIQAQARQSGERRHELLPVTPGFGLSALPEPNAGDIFFDLEGDPFVGEHGLEYLFGYHYRDEAGAAVYQAHWSFNRGEEKAAFERFVDFVTERKKTYPGLHIYHYAPYEPAALKRLMGRYASKEDEIDALLRGLVFVDLYSVVRNAVRASVESYSIKRLEAFYGYERVVSLQDANLALASLQAGLELGDSASISDGDKTAVQGYNQDDCISTEALRNWLEMLRADVLAHGTDVPRPPPGQDAPSEEAAIRLARHLQGGVLPIQGPPGTGKSHTGARMICTFVRQGLKVGITANSHKVIRNLLDKVIEASVEMGVDLRCVQKAKEKEDDLPRLIFAKDNAAVFDALSSGQCKVAGATGFLWARDDAHEVLDVLVVDEAAQMSLANVLAVSHAAKRLILLGDPQQLDQPTQGTHPDGTGVSSLEHVLGGKQTIEPDRGLFLAETWRMNPAICAFDSELFYEGKLHPVDGCDKQVILSDGPIKGAGLRYVSVPHSGNKSFSIEEAGAVTQIVMSILNSNSRWIDRDGTERSVTMEDIVIITPYNAQVFEIQQRLPGARVGTVDKFQGQEAPIAIYSMATSSHADAPRGMEFLYSANRFNVAISRAKCLAILVASPEIFEAECKTPRQMQLANAFCRYLELAVA